MIAFTLIACSSAPAPAPAPAPEAEPPAAAAPGAIPEEVPPEPALGADGTSTPPSVLRLGERAVELPSRHLEVRVDFDHGDFETVREALLKWGFTVEDGDGAALRVLAPRGDRWPERLEPLLAVRRVTETLGQDALPDGATRAGTAHFGPTVVHRWATREGGVQETMEGSALPGKPEIPRNFPAAVVRCLAPVRSAMVDGDPEGPGWERALSQEPLAWVVVLENFGACRASGWFVARADASVEQVSVAGQPVKVLSESALFDAAQGYLSVPRAATDEAAIAGVDILRRAPDDVLARVLPAVAPGAHQERLVLALAERDEAKAVAVARASSSPTLLAWAAGVDATTRAEVLANPEAGAEALVVAMSAWRPSLPQDQPVLARLVAHADPQVRMRAQELAIEAGASACAARIPEAKTMPLEAARALYAECPQQPVRLQAFSRVVQLDRAAATELVSATAARPETVRAGIAAVRALNGLERDDLLEALVSNTTADRDVRAEALRTLARVGRSPHAVALAEKHGAFLGVKLPPPKAVAVEK